MLGYFSVLKPTLRLDFSSPLLRLALIWTTIARLDMVVRLRASIYRELIGCIYEYTENDCRIGNAGLSVLDQTILEHL